MFIDSSVFVVILLDEDNAEDVLTRLPHGREATTSGLVMLETAIRLSSKLGLM
ncbi:MAG: type II toxin-antitoxin system VapC family toxin [Nitrococcus sp.]|nr:type II toxin-antitoxin system VapC family toxin [Nitrococcus sp.]